MKEIIKQLLRSIKLKQYLFANIIIAIVLTLTLPYIELDRRWLEYERMLILVWFSAIPMVIISIWFLIDICGDLKRNFNYRSADNMIESAKDFRNDFLVVVAFITVGLFLGKCVFLLLGENAYTTVDLALLDYRLPILHFANFYLALYVSAGLYVFNIFINIHDFYELATERLHKLHNATNNQP